MFGEIDLNKVPKFELTLCKPNKEPIGDLVDFWNGKYTAKFRDIDELDFDIPFYILDGNFLQIKNPHWDNVKGDYLILLNDEKYFVITYPNETGDSGKDFKSIKCFSYEFTLSKKKIRGFRGTRKLYDTSQDKAGILNLLEQQTKWKIGYIDNDAKMDITGSHEKYRWFDVSEKTWLEFLNDIQSSYDCYFQYDTINKVINVYANKNVGEDKGLYISRENYLKTINKEVKFNELYTQLNIYGKDNLSINSINPLGTSYLEDFTYYINNGYMTDSLKNALANYNNLLNQKKDIFKGYLDQLKQYQSSQITKQNELDELNLQLKIIQDNIYVAIKSSQTEIKTLDLSSLRNQEISKQNEVNSKQNEINNIQFQIDTVNNNIKELQKLISKESNFTQEQLNELDDYIHQSTWQNENISDVNELYEEGKKAFAKINQPVIEFTIDVADFLKILEYQRDWDKLVLGDFVTINYNTFNEDIVLRIVSYTHDFNSNKLSISISSKDLKDDAIKYIGDIFKANANASTAVTMNKYIWDLSETNHQTINELINNDLDAARNAVIAGRNQDIRIDEHGINLKDMDNQNEQIRILSNVLAMTTDGGQTFNLAITPKGIVGEQIYSKVIGSEKLLITNTSGKFFVDGGHMTAIDMDLTLNRTDGKSKIIINPNDGIKIQTDGKDKFFADTSGNLTMDGRLKVTNNGIQMFDAYKNNNGGILQIFNNEGVLNAKIGCENGTSDNIGGTLIFYDDNGRPRLEAGISKNYNAGAINLKDRYETVKVAIYGDANVGQGVYIYDNYGKLKSYLKDNIGKINGQTIATQEWVESYVSSHMPSPSEPSS